MVDFRNYLKKTNQTLASFAKKVGEDGISPNYLSEIASFKNEPRLRTAHDIHVASGGMIAVNHWIVAAPAGVRDEKKKGKKNAK